MGLLILYDYSVYVFLSPTYKCIGGQMTHMVNGADLLVVTSFFDDILRYYHVIISGDNISR